MQQRRELPPTVPALIPIAGNFDRKPRSLDRDVTTIGRARGSDLCLEANEISTLHCIIYRTADGFRIRDCNSRCGVRVNGDSVKTSRLKDCDIVNLGPFSFELRLPANLFPPDGVKADPSKIEHWKQSRRKLAQRALRLRKRLLQGGAAAREQEWTQKAHLLKEKIRVYDQRLRELEEAEQELTEERGQLEKAAESQKQRVQSVEGDLARRLAEVDAEIQQRWQEFQQRCQAEESRGAGSRPVDASAVRNDADLDDLRRHLRDIEDQLMRQQEQLGREQEEFTIMKEQWVKAQSKSSAALEDQQAALASQEAAVRAQKAELARMMAELRKMQEDVRKQARPDVRALQDDLDRARKENAELRAMVADLENKPAAPGDFQHRLDDLDAEVVLLREELDRKDAILQELADRPAGPVDANAEKLRAENELLKKLLDEKSELISELSTKQGGGPKNEGDLERYEAELNEFRRQLETDRIKLNKEVEMLRERNKELDEAIREMEMEMSKERAELARERMRLERVREEVKSDMEKMQREAAVRDSMAPVQKLRDELTGKQSGAGKEKGINDRLRSMRNQLNDSPTASS